MSILGQQVRDAAASVRCAQKAVALVKAQKEQEKQRSVKISIMITDLEARACAALEKSADHLAREAADAIAELEDDHAASLKAQAAFGAEITRLTASLRQAQARLRELQRGQRVVTARDQVHKVGKRVSLSGQGALSEAEGTLAKIEDHQKTVGLADAAYADLTVSNNPADIVERLADAGCGPSTQTTADDVLARLKARAASDDAA